MRPACYLRVSTRQQAEERSTDSQRHALRRWLADKGCDPDVAVWYDEPARSGGSMRRPVWKRMLEEVRAGRHDTIIVHSLTRAGRTVKGLINWLDDMERAGVRVIALKEGIDTQDAGMARMIRTALLVMLALFAEMQREMTSEQTTDGIAAVRAADPDKARRWGGARHVGRGGRRLTDEQEAEVCALVDSGVPRREVGRRFGVNRETVSDIYRRVRA